MARRPGVRAKNGHWFSEAGGKGRYFGRCDRVSRAEAMARLWGALAGDRGVDRQGEREGGEGVGLRASPSNAPAKELCERINSRRGDGESSYFVRKVSSQAPDAQSKSPKQEPTAGMPQPPLPPLSPHGQEPTVKALADRFLAWVKAHRGHKAHVERSRHVRRFCEAFGDLDATAIGGSQIEAFSESLRASGHALDYVHKHLVSVGAMFHKGSRKGWIPPTCKPFASVEPLRLPSKALTEDALPTPDEVQTLFVAADADAHGQMGDIVRLYHATGARTHELIEATVGDFQRSTRQIVLSKHKRSRTLKEPVPRAITLNDTAFAIVQRCCEGREAGAPIFPRPSDGGHYPNVGIAERFQNVRKRAGVRDCITIYSFRHLWISEALMAGVDALLVAKMAGTSVKMVETVYGHFRAQSLADAQARLDAARAARR